MRYIIVMFILIMSLILLLGCEESSEISISPNIHNVIAVSDQNIYAVTNSKRVIVTGDNSFSQHSASEWEDIVGIVAIEISIVGLKEDGSLVFIGEDYGAKRWKNIKRLDLGHTHIVGLNVDNELVASGILSRFHFESGDTRVRGDASKDYVNNWTDVQDFSVGYGHTAAINSEGETMFFGYNLDGQGNLENFSEITMIKAAYFHTLGLNQNKRVVYAGSDYHQLGDMTDFNDIVFIEATEGGSIGVKSDGSIVTAGPNLRGELELSDWENVIAVYGCSYFTVGLKDDGTILFAGTDKEQNLNTEIFTDIVTIFN